MLRSFFSVFYFNTPTVKNYIQYNTIQYNTIQFRIVLAEYDL